MYDKLIIDTFLASSDKRATEILISNIFKPLPEGQSELELNDRVDGTCFFIWFITREPHKIALKFLSIIQSSVETSIIRNIFILFLYSLFSSRMLAIPSYTEFKPILLSLLQQETSIPAFNTLSRIVSILVCHLFEVQDFNEDWVELLDYIHFLLLTDVKKGFWLIRDLPINMKGQLFPKNYGYGFLCVILGHLKNTWNEDEDVWVLAFGATCTMALLLIGNQRGYLLDDIRGRIMKTVSELVYSGKQVYIQKGFQSIDCIRDKERNNRSYGPRITFFINSFADWVYRLPGVTDETLYAARKFSSFSQFNQG